MRKARFNCVFFMLVLMIAYSASPIISLSVVDTKGTTLYMAGNEIYDSLKKGTGTSLKELTDYFAAGGYVIGVADCFQLLRQANKEEPLLPSNMPVNQLTDIVLKYLENHPEKRHLGAAELILLALSKAFPKNKILE